MSNIKKILAVDPGTNIMGWAFCHYHIDTNKLVVIESGVIKPGQIVRKNKDDRDLFEEKILKVDVISTEYRKLVEKCNADFHVSEDAFFHFRSPQAYASLSLCIYTLNAVLYKLYKEKMVGEQDVIRRKQLLQEATLHKFPPRQIKKIVSLRGDSNKDQIQNAIFGHTDIEFKTIPEKPLTEHEADAIGGAYTFSQSLYSLGILV